MNPIEKIWAIMKRKVEKMLSKTREELIECIQIAWDEIDQPMIEATIRFTIDTNMTKVIAVDGEISQG